MQARYYDPVIGRFYSNDPVGTLGHFYGTQGVQGFNRYGYVNNNPYKYTDPSGKNAGAVACLGGPITCGAGLLLGGLATLVVADNLVNPTPVFNESTDPVEGILDGASAGDQTKGRTKNYDKPGGIDQANSDFDDVVDLDSIETITDGKGGEGRRGTVNDGSGRKVNVRPNSTDGRPTVEIQDGKNKTKIRYDEESR